jgi:uncharacterized protein (TIGR02246 family)
LGNRNWTWCALGLVFLAAVSSPGRLHAQAQTSRSADEATIRTQIAAYAEARRTGNGNAQAEYYTEDADIFLLSARQMTKGRAEIARRMAVPGGNVPFRVEVENIAFLGSDVALVDAHYYNAAPEPHGHAFYVMVLRGGHWLIRSARLGNYLPATPAAR